MKKNNFSRFVVPVAIVLSLCVSSCQKEELQAPASEETSTLIFIRAVEKDSTVINSDQILLR